MGTTGVHRSKIKLLVFLQDTRSCRKNITTRKLEILTINLRSIEVGLKLEQSQSVQSLLPSLLHFLGICNVFFTNFYFVYSPLLLSLTSDFRQTLEEEAPACEIFVSQPTRCSRSPPNSDRFRRKKL